MVQKVHPWSVILVPRWPSLFGARVHIPSIYLSLVSATSLDDSSYWLNKLLLPHRSLLRTISSIGDSMQWIDENICTVHTLQGRCYNFKSGKTNSFKRNKVLCFFLIFCKI